MVLEATRIRPEDGGIFELHDGGTAAPGSFQLDEGRDGMLYVCPCGCGRLGGLRFRTDRKTERPSWIWDGNEDRPTLSPSIRHRPDPDGETPDLRCDWHGFLKAGVWTSA